MPHNSLTEQQLRHPDSIKWSQYPADVLPMWIADMDFPASPAILNRLHERLERPLGYAPEQNDESPLTRLLLQKLATQGLAGLTAAGLKYLPSVVPALYTAIYALSQPGDKVVTMTPVYHPFHMATTEQGRESVGVPLLDTPDGWRIDWEALDRACEGAPLLMLCHPHNPTGRVWTHEELNRLRDLAVKHNLYVVSDELHADLRYTADAFESFAADPRVQDKTVTVTGPCKAFNLAGLGIGVMATHNAALMNDIKRQLTGLNGHPSSLALTMWHAALTEGQPWLEQTVNYLRENRDFLYAYLRRHMPYARFHEVEATYLAWVDLRDHPQGHNIQDYLLREAKIAVHPGSLFAPAPVADLYRGYIRLNFAMPRALLSEALDRMRQALEKA